MTTEKDITEKLAVVRMQIVERTNPRNNLERLMGPTHRRAMVRYIDAHPGFNPIQPVYDKLEKALKSDSYTIESGSLQWEELPAVEAEIGVRGSPFFENHHVDGVAGIVGTIRITKSRITRTVSLFHRYITHPFYQYGYRYDL